MTRGHILSKIGLILLLAVDWNRAALAAWPTGAEFLQFSDTERKVFMTALPERAL